MKTAEPTTTTHNRESSGNESTFFNESGGQGFFDKTGIHYSANTGNNRSPNNVFFPLGSIQPKLTIGQPNDKYEQEADAMADQVVQRLAKSDTIQPKCAACEQEENGIAPKLQFKPIFESDEPGLIQHKCDTCTQSEIHPIPIQTKNGSLPTLQASGDLETRLKGTKGGGQALHNDTQQTMGEAFGTNFSQVRVHTNSNAVQMNQELGAKAFTNGSDVYFNTGQYNPKSSVGQHLLAHELTHVVQQGGKDINSKEIDSKNGLKLSHLDNINDTSKCKEKLVQRKNVPTIQLNLDPPGNCIQGIHDGFQRTVKAWCDHPSGRACNATESCNRLRQKIRRNERCAHARRVINDTCYNGGDPGHIIAERDARRAQANCMALFRGKCELNDPVPVPVPQTDTEKIKAFIRRVIQEGLDATQAAEEFLQENPGLAWTIIGLGVAGIIALIADDFVGGFVDDFVIVPILAILRVAWRFAW